MPFASSFGLSLLYMKQPTHPGQPIKQITEAEFICPTEQGVEFKEIEEIPLRRQEIHWNNLQSGAKYTNQWSCVPDKPLLNLLHCVCPLNVPSSMIITINKIIIIIVPFVSFECHSLTCPIITLYTCSSELVVCQSAVPPAPWSLCPSLFSIVD